MKFLIYNPSARIGGALSILNDVYKDIEKSENSSDEYIFVVGNADLAETRNITVCKFPWVQKSWLYRLFFDLFVTPQFVKRHKIDHIVSYQNITIPFTSVPQTLYLQQSLPFIGRKFKLHESKLLWLYQNVIGKLIIRSVKKATKIIVQTQWMKKACAEICNISPDKIEVISPRVFFNKSYQYEQTAESKRTFFFPASGLLYKNHQTIIDACLLLKAQKVTDFKVIFTLAEDENPHVSRLRQISLDNDLNVLFAGRFDREKVCSTYCESVLVFPSYVETFGLPLLEAKLIGAPIIASDTPFSHEILDGYDEASFFEPFDSKRLALLMKQFIERF